MTSRVVKARYRVAAFPGRRCTDSDFRIALGIVWMVQSIFVAAFNIWIADKLPMCICYTPLVFWTVKVVRIPWKYTFDSSLDIRLREGVPYFYFICNR